MPLQWREPPAETIIVFRSSCSQSLFLHVALVIRFLKSLDSMTSNYASIRTPGHNRRSSFLHHRLKFISVINRCFSMSPFSSGSYQPITTSLDSMTRNYASKPTDDLLFCIMVLSSSPYSIVASPCLPLHPVSANHSWRRSLQRPELCQLTYTWA